MNTKLITPPAAEPLSLTDVKNHLRISITSEDSYLTNLISAARRLAEMHTRRALITQTWDLFLDHFPGAKFYNTEGWWDGVKDAPISVLYGSIREICLPYAPLQSITSINAYDDNDAATLVDSTTYYVDTASEPGRVVLRNGQTWPTILLRPGNGVAVRFIAGYGDAETNVPEDIRQAMLTVIGDWYENRGDTSQKQIPMALSSMPASARAALSPYIIRKL